MVGDLAECNEIWLMASEGIGLSDTVGCEHSSLASSETVLTLESR